MKVIINSKQSYYSKTLVSPSAQKFYEPLLARHEPNVNIWEGYPEPHSNYFIENIQSVNPSQKSNKSSKTYSNGYGTIGTDKCSQNGFHKRPVVHKSDDIQDNGKLRCPSSRGAYKRLLGMITLCLVDFSAATCFSIIGPFFPTEAEKKGVDKFWIGAIFGTFQGIQFLMSPFFGLYMYRMGVKRLYLVGIGVNAVAIFAFGFTTYLPDDRASLFVAITFSLRTLQGLGCAAYLTSSYLFTLNIYPDNVGIVFGILETFAGLGFAIGPAFGGVLYMVGGYMVPFLGVSLSLALLLIAAIYFLPPIADISGHHPKNDAIKVDEKCALLAESLPTHKIPDPDNLINYRDPQRPRGGTLSQALAFVHLFGISPSVGLDYLILVVGALSVGFVDPTLEPHLRARRLGLSTAGVGGVFVALSATYALSAMLLGRLMDCPVVAGPKVRRALLCASCAVTALGLLSSGPSPILVPYLTTPSLSIFIINRTQLLTVVCLAQILIGAAFGAVIVVSFTDIMAVATSTDPNSTHALVSGLYTSALALGSFLGPVLGGCLTHSLNYEWSATVISAINGLAFAISLVVTSYELGRGSF